VVDLLLSRAAIGEMLDEVLVRDVVATAALLADVVDDRRRERLADEVALARVESVHILERQCGVSGYVVDRLCQRSRDVLPVPGGTIVPGTA